jgi:ParB/RepB/Spo0J family partition protein
LIESIREHGVIQAGLARPSPVKAGRFELVAGERRWNACRCVGAATMPLKIRELSDEQVIELQGVENMHREDLNALDEAVKYQQLIEVYGRRGIKTTEAVAMVHAKLKVSEATIFARMRLLKLPGEVKEAVYGGVLPGSHADLIAKLEHNREVQLEVAGEVLNPGRNAETDGKVLSVRETARLVNAGLEKIKKLAEFNTLRDEFTKKGNLVLSASDNKKLFTHTHNPTLVRSEQFVDGTDSGSETDWVEWKKAMGKHAPDPVLAQGLNGEAVIVYPKRAAIEAAKKNAPRKEKSVNLRSAQEKAERCQRKRANDARAAALERLLPRIEAPHSVPPRALWELMAHAVAGDAHADQERAMCSRRKLDVPKINGYADKGKAIAAHLKTLKTEREFQAFTIELLIGGGCYFDPKVLSKAEALFELQTGGVKKRK